MVQKYKISILMIIWVSLSGSMKVLEKFFFTAGGYGLFQYICVYTSIIYCKITYQTNTGH